MSQISLEELIAETLSSIVNGVKRARDDSMANGAIPIALSAVGGVKVSNGGQLVTFNVQLEAQKSQAISGSTNGSSTLVSVVSASLGMEGEKGSTSKTNHTVTFNVPINFDAAWSQVSSESTQ